MRQKLTTLSSSITQTPTFPARFAHHCTRRLKKGETITLGGWKKISEEKKEGGKRTNKQCKRRWLRFLDPGRKISLTAPKGAKRCTYGEKVH